LRKRPLDDGIDPKAAVESFDSVDPGSTPAAFSAAAMRGASDRIRSITSADVLCSVDTPRFAYFSFDTVTVGVPDAPRPDESASRSSSPTADA